ncbi:hypothetical protein Ddc_10930 [Ditylenchus destructor]|nr:hypothetical protein Ddc_10930 [Ditylenchus destructor]
MSSTKQCVICEDQGENAKIRNHYGCENSCDACRKFFESNVKEMTKSSHKFLGGKNADRHCYNNFGCEVKGKRPCTSCRFLKCIDNQMNPELPLRNAAREVQRNDPEGQNRRLDDYTKVLRGTYDFNLAILLSAQQGARVNSNIVPAMISENIPMDPGYHPSNGSYQQSNSDYCHGYMPNVQGTHNWNNQNNGNGYTEFDVSYGSSQVPVSNNSQQSANSHYGYVPHVVTNNPQQSTYSHVVFNNPQQSTYSHVVFNNPLHNPLGNSSCMPAYLVNNAPLHNDGNTISYMGSYGNTGPNSHTHGTMGQVAQLLPPLQNPSTGTLNHEVAISHFGCITNYAPGQLVNHAGPSTQIHAGANEIEEKVQNLQLESIVPKDSEIKDTTHNKRCACNRSLGKPETNPVTGRKTLLDTTKDGPHHFANWMCFFGLLFDFLAVEIPKEELFGKSICPAGRCYQSHDLMEHFVIESEKEGGKYVELKKSELRSGDYYFIWCRSKDQQYWQIYYGTDDHCEAGYGPYRGYDERRYFFNKEFDQQRKDQTNSGK